MDSVVYDFAILGGGISALSLAEDIHVPTVILEAESDLGGLCRSFDFRGVPIDVGPHIIFSKYDEVLKRHTERIATNRIRRMNRILLNGKFIKYPFENDLASCRPEDRDEALQGFLNNPYENFPAHNMEQFFLKTFGEGISNLYLTPYNRKIWKFEPSYLDTQMVDRIPKPPRDDVISSASGKITEGYVHQLYFHYPTSGGFQTLVNDYEARLGENVTVKRNFEVSRIQKNQTHWIIESQSQLIEAKTIVSTLPLPKLVEFLDAPKPIRDLADQMKYNSIHIVLIELSNDVLVDQFALYIPDEDVSFHRLSRLNFLGENYVPTSGGALLMAEITFRKDMKYANWNDEEIIESVLVGLKKLSIIENEEVLAAKVITFEYAYVIYDLNHRSRTDTILEWVNSQGIMTTGRFGKFEYQNSDQVVYESINLRKRIMENFNA